MQEKHWSKFQLLHEVVTKDVEPYSVVAGSPAKHVKYRFEPSAIEELLSFKVYDWPTDKFNALKPHLCNPDFEQLKSHNQLKSLSIQE